MENSIIQSVRGRSNIICIALIVGVLFYTFSLSIKNGWHKIFPDPINVNIQTIGIAISEMQYGATGYRGYLKVRNILFDDINKRADVQNNPAIVNRNIKTALNIETSPDEQQYSMLIIGVGLVNYYKIAFSLFGFSVESLSYLYYLLLAVSVSFFIITFYREIDLLNILLLFSCSHLFAVRVAPVVGFQLNTVFNSRFHPVLAIIPSFYLALLIWNKYEFTLKMAVGAVVQTFVLLLIYQSRTSVRSQIIFLCMILVLALLKDWIKKPKGKKYVFDKLRIWPFAMVLTGLILLNIHFAFQLHSSYAEGTSNHSFWHPAYLGLSAHPSSSRKYGIHPGDGASYNLVDKRLRERGMEGIMVSRAERKKGVRLVTHNNVLFEAILKEECLNLLRKDTLFVISSYLYKPKWFLRSYFSPDSTDFDSIHNMNAIPYLFEWSILIIIMIGSFLTGDIFLNRWQLYFILISLEFSCSLLPTMLYLPWPHLIADSATLFTMLIYMSLSGLLYLVFAKLKKIIS